jgi:hypothetical protein
MKLRLRGNTLRLRLTRDEVDAIASGAAVEETIQFAPDSRLTYGIEAGDDVLVPSARLAGSRIIVTLPRRLARDWATSDHVGITARVPNGTPDELTLLIEKDFACLHRAHEEPGAFPNPAAR